ncbi:MAG: cupin domain-containing protein [Rhodospirillaceae bacterium]
MRAYILVIAAAAVFASPAFAQSAPAPAAPTMMKIFSAGADIPALIAKAKADRKGDAPLVIEPILSLAPYGVSLEYRPAAAPAALHEKDAEIMYVLEGSGTIVTGGKLVDEKRSNAANLNGTSIADGKSQAVVKGDVLIVPENTPHQVLPGGGAPIVLMTLHVPRPAPANWP